MSMINQPKAWISPAKLNLFLYITGRRADGYHNLQTLFQFIDYSDYLYFSPRSDRQVCLKTPFLDLPHDDNLVVKAARLLIAYCQQHDPQFLPPYGVDITIDKNIPMGGGLGGGSSNAATTLIALNTLWQLNISSQHLMDIGKTLGADVPVFIFGHSAFAEGIGEQLTAVDIAEDWYLIIKPAVNIATVNIFTHPLLKRDSKRETLTQRLQSPFTNDSEDVVKLLYPDIARLFDWLSNYAPTRLTGTGSCLFTVCTSQQQALILQNQLKEHFNQNIPFSSFIAQGINQIEHDR